MASIRRTMSYYNDRSYQNGSNGPFTAQSPSQKLFSHDRTTLSPVRRFIAGIFFQKHHHSRRSGQFSWEISLLRCFLCFFLGFLLGMAPLNNDFKELKQNDLRRSNFPYKRTPEAVNVARNTIELGDFEKPKENDSLVGAVELGVVERTDITDMNKILDFGPDKQIIVITPTYNRAMQAYYLNRLGQVLRLVKPPVLWIVVETNAVSMETADILRSMGIMYRHLVCVKNSTDIKDRGVQQRNTALMHIERHRLDGIIYFADDDNIYSFELFQSMREISRFGTWPVSMLAQSKNKVILEGPVCNRSRVTGWHTNEKSRRLRRFHVDMSGFAFNSTILWDSKTWQRPTSDPIRQLDTVKEGFQGTTFMEQIVEDESQMECIPLGCYRITNWHLHLEASGLAYPKGWMLQKNLDVWM